MNIGVVRLGWKSFPLLTSKCEARLKDLPGSNTLAYSAQVIKKKDYFLHNLWIVPISFSIVVQCNTSLLG